MKSGEINMSDNKMIENDLYETIFANKKIMLSSPLNSCECHRMTYSDVEILGMFLDVVSVDAEDLKRILIKGYVALIQARSRK